MASYLSLSLKLLLVESRRRAHIHRHELERLCLLGECLCNCRVWLPDHSAQGALLEHFGLVGPPHAGDRRSHPLHAVLELGTADLL